MSMAGSARGVEDGAELAGGHGGEVTLEIDDDVVGALGVERGQGGVDAVGAGGQGRVGHDGDAAGFADGGGDRLVGTGDGDGADAGLASAVEHMEDHGAAGDVGEGFAGQPRRCHARGDDDDWCHDWSIMRDLWGAAGVVMRLGAAP